MSDVDLMMRFMVQVMVVLLTCRVIGWIGRRYLKQAQVTMEMIAGVLLGPSLLGLISPKVQDYLFPQYLHAGDPASGRHPSMSILYVVAQTGLVLYMFLVGSEFDIGLIATRAKGAVAVSVAGILAPLALGVGLALTLMRGRTDLFIAGQSLSNQALYTGAAMCITAFPMLARIIFEAGIAGTAMGTLALASGATNDVAAWTILAIVLSVTKGSPVIALTAVGGGVLYVVVLLTIGKSLLANLGKIVTREQQMSPTLLAVALIVLFAGAWFTDNIGVYAVFGAFIVGMAMPKGLFQELMRSRLEPVTVGLLLPFFFVFSGLNTHLSGLNSPALWYITAAVTLAAIVGKYGGCYAAARMCGESNRESLAIGALMNSRGLMELIIINIGLQQKVITIQLYTIMVLMAILTTVMAAPLFEWIYGKEVARPHPTAALEVHA